MSTTTNGISSGARFAIEHLESGVTLLRLTRPEASNALELPFWRDFPHAIGELDRAGTTRALVISAEGKNFCGGMDVSVFSGGITAADTAPQREAFYYFALEMQATFTALETARFPAIAAIHGACVGAGLEMVSACDLRFASDDAYFRLEEINIGMMADVGSLQRLPHVMPAAVVAELAYMGETLPAARAKEIGFVNATAPSAEATLELALAAARRIAAKAPLAIAGTKDALRYVREHGVAAGLDRAALMQAAIWNPSDITGAIAARRNQSEASFTPLEPKREIG